MMWSNPQIKRACSLRLRRTLSLGCVLAGLQSQPRLFGKACLNASDAQAREAALIGKSLAGMSAVTSMRDAAHCVSLRAPVNCVRMMDGDTDGDRRY